MSFSGDFAGTSLTLGANWTSMDRGDMDATNTLKLGTTNLAPGTMAATAEMVDKQKAFRDWCQRRHRRDLAEYPLRREGRPALQLRDRDG